MRRVSFGFTSILALLGLNACTTIMDTVNWKGAGYNYGAIQTWVPEWQTAGFKTSDEACPWVAATITHRPCMPGDYYLTFRQIDGLGVLRREGLTPDQVAPFTQFGTGMEVSNPYEIVLAIQNHQAGYSIRDAARYAEEGKGAAEIRIEQQKSAEATAQAAAIAESARKKGEAYCHGPVLSLSDAPWFTVRRHW
jgi:hypothetical protein